MATVMVLNHAYPNRRVAYSIRRCVFGGSGPRLGVKPEGHLHHRPFWTLLSTQRFIKNIHIFLILPILGDFTDRFPLRIFDIRDIFFQYPSTFIGKRIFIPWRGITQNHALGTGNAVYNSLEYLLTTVEHVYVSFGTQPLVRNETVEGVLDIHLQEKLSFTLATVIMDKPYAPLIRNSEGKVTESVETHLENATMPEYGETNIGAYWASKEALSDVLCRLHEALYVDDEKQYNTKSGELGYPNEMVRGCLAAGLGVDGVPIANEIEMMGIKTPETLERIREILVETHFNHAKE